MKRIDENHSFNINVACIVGERKAILLKEQYGWCLKNLHNDRNIHGGHAWTYNSAKAYAQKFPYWNPKSISRWLKEMENEGWIASANLNKVAFDRTKWYTVNFRRYDLAVTGCDMKIEDIETWKKEIKKSISQNEEWMDQNEESDFSKTDNLISQNEEPIPPLTTSYPSREPESRPQTSNSDFFSPDKHETAAAEIIRYLDANPMYLNGMAKGDWKRAVKGHCLKLQKLGKWNELQIPVNEGQYFSWIGARIAGAKSWFTTAAEFDRKSGRQPDAVTIKSIPTPQPVRPTVRASAAEARKIAGI